MLLTRDKFPAKLTTKPIAVLGFPVKSLLPSAEVCVCVLGVGGVSELGCIQIPLLVGGFHWHPCSEAAVSPAGRALGIAGAYRGDCTER